MANQSQSISSSIQSQKPITSPASHPLLTKKNNGLFIFFIVLLLFGLCILAVFIYYENQQLKGADNSYQQVWEYQKQISTSASKSMEDWKIYKNIVFSFKYPTLWDTYMIVESIGSTLMVAPKETVDNVKQMQGGFGGGSFLTLTVTTKSEPPIWLTDEYWNVTSEPITIGGILGSKYRVNLIQDLPGFNKGDEITSAVAKYGNKYIQIDLLDQTYKEIFESLLATFMFTDFAYQGISQQKESSIHELLAKGALIEEIDNPNLLLPIDINVNQIKKYFKMGDLMFALVTRNSTNIQYVLPNNFVISFVGMLFAREGDETWTKMVAIRDITATDKNNPYYLVINNKKLLLTVVDQNGAGSGEGMMKVFGLSGTNEWTLDYCYYFGTNYDDPDTDGDYYAFSTKFSEQTPKPITSCSNVQLISL